MQDLRQITLAIAFPIVMVIFIILGILVLRKDSKYWGNRFFASFFWATALTLLFNLLYLFSTNQPYIAGMNLVTAAMAVIGIIGLLLGILVVYKGEDVIMHSYKLYLILGVCIALIIVQVTIPGAVYFLAGSPEDPKWSLPMGIYELLLSQALIIAVYYFSIQLYRVLTPEMRTKFIKYLIGLAFLDLTFISVTIDNLNIFGEAYSLIGAALNFCVLFGAILIYLGIVRRQT